MSLGENLDTSLYIGKFFYTLLAAFTEWEPNEPVELVRASVDFMHVAYRYNYARQLCKSQAQVREVIAKLYNVTLKGCPGDEAQGAMSSWYVISAMGLYSVCPGTDQYVLSSPVFNKTTISLENGKKFTIVANNNSKTNVYIKSTTLNGKPLNHNFITHTDLMNGGEMVLEMSDTPNTQRGIADEDKPFSLSKAN